MRKKVLIVHPARVLDLSCDYVRVYQPLSAAYLAPVFRANGFEVSFMDMYAEGIRCTQQRPDERVRIGIPREVLFDKVVSWRPDVVVVSSTFTLQYPEAVEACQVAKNALPDVFTVIGGVHVTGLHRAGKRVREHFEALDSQLGIRNLKSVDCFAVGGVGSAVEIATSIAAGGRPPRIARSQDERQWAFLPDYSVYSRKNYRSDVHRAATGLRAYPVPLMSSTGCPNHCNYCCTPMLWGSRLHSLSQADIKSLLDQIESLGYDELVVQDDNCLASKSNADRLFRALGERGFSWMMLAVDRALLDEPILESITKNGCRRILVSIETAAPVDLVALGKRTYQHADNDATRQHIKYLTDSGVTVDMDFMVGFPGETMDDVDRTLEYASILKEEGAHQIDFNFVTPFPGTTLLEEQVANVDWSQGYAGFSLKRANLKLKELDTHLLANIVRNTEARLNERQALRR